MRNILLLHLLLLCTSVFAQDTSAKKRLQYFGLNQISLQAGSSSEKFAVHTTNGVRSGNWYGGLSTGIDWYGVRSIPLLVSVYKAFGKARHQPFLYGNVGTEFPWMEDYKLGATSYNFKNGLTAGSGIGYFVNLKNKTALSLSAGFNYKAMRLDKSVEIVPIAGLPFFSVYKEKYYYRRIVISIGLKI